MVAFCQSAVMALGLLPLAEAAMARSPSIAMPAVIVFFVAFVLSHPFAKVVGAWPSTIIVALVAGALACLIEVRAARRLDH